MPSTQNIAHLRPNDPVMTASNDVGSGITAAAGGGQTNATLLTEGCNEVTTVASANDSVKLPPARGGMVVFVANQGANSMQVFGSGTDTINAVATATGVAVANGKNALFFCIKSAVFAPTAAAGEWYMILTA